MTGKTKICPFCQVEFVPENASKYCSDRCRRGMYAKQRREQQNSREFKCAFCGDGFFSERKRKYCSVECKLKSYGRGPSKTKPRKKPNLSLAQVALLSRQAGMSYGEYVMKMGL